MKIRCEVLSVETTGDGLRVKWQGRGVRDAKWRPWSLGSFEIARTEVTLRAYHVGRVFVMDVVAR